MAPAPMSHRAHVGHVGTLDGVQRAVVLRAADGVDIDLYGSRRYEVTVDDPETGAINDLVARPAAPTTSGRHSWQDAATPVRIRARPTREVIPP